MALDGVPRRLAANAIRAVRRIPARRLSRHGSVWISLRVGASVHEASPPRFFSGLEDGVGLLDVLRTLAVAADDADVAGVLLRLEGAPHGFSHVAALRRGIAAVRAAGKPVAAFAEALGVADYWVASAATEVWLPEAGSLHLLGLRAESTFVRGLLEQLGIAPEVVRIGSYKSAGEMFTRDAMSPEQREQIEALLDDLYDELVASVAAGRRLDPGEVRARIDRGLFHGRAAVEAGLADRCLFPDEIEETLAQLAPATVKGNRGRPGERTSVRSVPAARYFKLRASDAGWRPLFADLPRIAYVVATGMIRRGGGARGIASEALRGLLEGLAKDVGVRAVVLRLESPGGDGLASDLLWRAVRLVGREKPVVVSMGDVAASGGYYVACAADAVFAEASTLTGSIGVVGGKANLGPLYERLGVGKDAVERGARAGLLSAGRGFTPDERSALRGELASVYDTFLRRVAEGRKLEPAAVEEVAGGRVWSGLRARANGLVDAIGGPLEALREAARRAGLGERERVLVELHPRRPRLPDLRSLAQLALGFAGEPR